MQDNPTKVVPAESVVLSIEHAVHLYMFLRQSSTFLKFQEFLPWNGRILGHAILNSMADQIGGAA